MARIACLLLLLLGFTVIVEAQTPTIPSAPTIQNISSDIRQVNLSWSPVSGATSYHVYRSASSNGESGTTPIYSGNLTSWTDKSAPNGQVAYYVVTALSTAGESVFSNETYALPPLELLSINSGGGWDGDFIFDAGYIGGTTYSVPSWWPMDTSHVSGSAPADVYRSNRWANFEGYFFYVLTGMQPLASYKIRLDFAEIYWSSPYRRNFDVYLNDTRVLQNFDMVLAAGGPNTAVAEDFNVTTDINGDISAFFVTDTDNAQVNGIEDFQITPGFALTASPKPLHLATSTTDTASVTVAPLNSYAGNVSLSASVVDSTNTPVPGITASCGSTPVSVIDGASHTAPVSIAVASNVPDGTYALKVTGTDTNGTATQTALLPVIVSSLTVMRLVWTTDYTTTPVTQIASTQGKFGGNAAVHLTLAIPPGAYSPIATSVVVHEVAAPDASGDIVVNNFALSGGPSLVCGEPNPLIPSGWSASYGDVSWPVGGRNGNYLVTATVQYTDSTGDMHNFTETDTFDREDLLITSTIPVNPAPLLWDPTNPNLPNPAPITASFTAAYKASGTATLKIYHSYDNVNPVQILSQAFLTTDGQVALSWNGLTSTPDGNGGFLPADPGVYLFQWNLSDTTGSTDSDKSSFLTINTPGIAVKKISDDGAVATLQISYGLTSKDVPPLAGSAGQIDIYDPTLKNIFSDALSDQKLGDPAPLSIGSHIITVTIPSPMYSGDYTFLVSPKDNDVSNDKANRQRYALQHNNIGGYPGTIAWAYGSGTSIIDTGMVNQAQYCFEGMQALGYNQLKSPYQSWYSNPVLDNVRGPFEDGFINQKRGLFSALDNQEDYLEVASLIGHGSQDGCTMLISQIGTLHKYNKYVTTLGAVDNNPNNLFQNTGKTHYGINSKYLLQDHLTVETINATNQPTIGLRLAYMKMMILSACDLDYGDPNSGIVNAFFNSGVKRIVVLGQHALPSTDCLIFLNGEAGIGRGFFACLKGDANHPPESIPDSIKEANLTVNTKYPCQVAGNSSNVYINLPRDPGYDPNSNYSPGDEVPFEARYYYQNNVSPNL